MNRIVTVIIICAFVLSSAVLAIMGTEIYKMSTETEASRAVCDTSAYFTDIIRECEDTSSARTASIGGKIPALVLRADTEDNGDEVWYFVYEGNLKKLITGEGQTVSPEEGIDIMPLAYADFVFITDELLDISYKMNSGEDGSVKLYLPGRKGDQ